MSAPSYKGKGTSAHATTTGVTPTNPSHTTGDYLILGAEGDNTNFGSDPAPSSQAWPAIIAAVVGNGTKLGLWGRRATSASQADPTITPTSANHTYAQVFAFENVHQVYPIGMVAQSGMGSNLARLLGGKTFVDDTLLAFFSTWATDSAGPAASAESHSTLTLTERNDEGTDDGNGGGFTLHTAPMANAGAFEAASYTDALAGGKAAATLALNPIADVLVEVAITIDGDPLAAVGVGGVTLIDVTQRAATYLVVNDNFADAPAVPTNDDGQATANLYVPYTDHEYIAVYTDESGEIYGSSQRLTYSGGFPEGLIEINTSPSEGGDGADRPVGSPVVRRFA